MRSPVVTAGEPRATSLPMRLRLTCVSGAGVPAVMLVCRPHRARRAGARADPTRPQSGKSAVMQDFVKLLDGASYKKGTEIDFSASGKGKLVTKIDGKQVRAGRRRSKRRPRQLEASDGRQRHQQRLA